MAISRRPLLQGLTWNVGAFGAGQAIRLATNVVLARLLVPELFGVMQIVLSLQTGAALLSDIGLNQNIVYSKHAEDPEFYNTAWTLQVVRGVLLWLVFSIATLPVAHFYRSPVLVRILPVMALTFIIYGLTSNSRALLQKRMQYNLLTAFETGTAIVGSVALVIIAYLDPTIWALVFGNLAGALATMIGSYLILPNFRHRFFISKQHAKEIVSFGKWIFVASIVYYLSTNFDRLYLAKIVPLSLFGVYGIARSFADLLNVLVQRLGNNVVFPFLASHSHIARPELRAQLAPIRMRFMALAGLGLSLFATMADLLIKALYDQRYQAAAWMLPVLIVGAWFAILASISESTLLGIGRPNYSVVGNGLKFCFLAIGLYLSATRYGVLGGVLVVALSDLFRYLPLLIGQIRESFSFARQDVIITIGVSGLIALLEALRWACDLGMSFDQFPIKWN